jgi:hypothetical protein
MHQQKISVVQGENDEVTSRGMVPLVAGISKITTGVLRLGLCEQTCKKDDNKMLAGSKNKNKKMLGLMPIPSH